MDKGRRQKEREGERKTDSHTFILMSIDERSLSKYFICR